MSAGTITLPEDETQSRWALLAWLAYPQSRNAWRAMTWLADWGLRRIRDNASIRPNRLDRHLASMEARFRLRLAVAETMNARLQSARLKHPPWKAATWDDELNAAHDASLRSPPRDGGPLPPIAIGPLRIVINSPPTTSRALADFALKRRANEGEQSNQVRRLIRPSRPVMALAIASLHLGPGPAYMKARRADWDAEDLATWGLLEAAAFGEWPVAPLVSLAESIRRELIDYPEMPFCAGDLLQWRTADTF